MTTYTPKHIAAILAVLVALASALIVTVPVAAKGKPVTHTPSYVNLYADAAHGSSTATANAISPCTGRGCSNGVRFTWAKGSCYEGDRYAPVTLVWTLNGQVAQNAWTLTAPCSTGIQIGWAKNNTINSAKWLGASSANTKQGLAICFQFKHECNAGHCVTAGCIPSHTNGMDVFFQSGDSPAAAGWMFKGKVTSSISVSGSPNALFWYGKTPPATPYALPTSQSSGASVGPSVVLTGRNGSGDPQYKSSSAPAGADGVDMTWFLPLYEKGTSRGCHLVGGKYWSSPPLAFAYTTNGILSAPVVIPGCPDTGYGPTTFNDVQFSFVGTVSGDVLTAADPWYFMASNAGCQKKYPGSADAKPQYTPADYPTGTLPQPPAGANGVIFTFAHDDFKATCWREGRSVVRPAVNAPGHTRISDFKG